MGEIETKHSNRKRVTRSSDFQKILIQKLKMEKSKEDYTIRYLCARVAAVIIILGAVCFLTGQPFARGATLCFMSILLMAMAIGYEQIDFVFKMIRVRLKKKQN